MCSLTIKGHTITEHRGVSRIVLVVWFVFLLLSHISFVLKDNRDGREVVYHPVERMFQDLKYKLSPSDPSSVYRLAAICAKTG